MQSRTLLGALRATRPGNWKEAFLYSLFSHVGGLAPLWVGMIVVTAYGQSFDLLRFARAGEFALYAAAILAPAIYAVVSERPSKPFSSQPIYILVSIIGLLLSVATYAMVAPAAIGVVPGAGLRVDAIARGTLVLFGVSVLLSLVITALDSARSQPDVAELAKEQERDLENAFNRLSE